MFCVTIAEKDANEAIEKAVSLGAEMIELRIDFLGDKNEINNCTLPWIATNRKGDQKLLVKAAEKGAKYADMDIGEYDKEVAKRLREKGCRVIVSFHDFEKTPNEEKLLEILEELSEKADIVKIVTTANHIEDNQRILSLYENTGIPLVAFAMGEKGKTTRFACLAQGSPWTYCALEKAVAPGQPTLEEANETKLYAVIGNPVKHSLSPDMHNANFESLGMKAVYTAVQVDDVKEFVSHVKERGIFVFNATLPHKIEIMKYLDSVDSLAEKIGAVNTVENKDGKLIGHNTDGYGALLSLKEKIEVNGKKIVILGAGGAARAVAFTLAEEGAEITILNRDFEKGKKLADGVGAKAVGFTDENLKKELSDADILINCTSVGMNSNESLVPKDYLRDLIVFDIVYSPMKTRLLMDAEKNGCKIITGDNMLVYQGAKAFEIWTGKKADVKIMFNALHKRLMPNIALIGFMGTGKSVVGKILSENLDREFIDLDEEIVKDAGISIPEIFEKYGEREFRRMEKEVVKRFFGKKNLVVSCGGGAILDDENVKTMKENSAVVLLKASPEKIDERLKEDKSRPLLNQKEKIKKIEEILNARKERYSSASDYSIDTDELSPREIAGKIIKMVEGNA